MSTDLESSNSNNRLKVGQKRGRPNSIFNEDYSKNSHLCFKVLLQNSFLKKASLLKMLLQLDIGNGRLLYISILRISKI